MTMELITRLLLTSPVLMMGLQVNTSYHYIAETKAMLTVLLQTLISLVVTVCTVSPWPLSSWSREPTS